MSGLKLFWEFAKASFLEIYDDKKTYLNAFFALILLDNIETIYPLLGVGEETNTFLALSIIATLLSFIVLSQVVLIQKRKRGGDGELKYFVPTFLLYNLYYSFLFFAGLLLFVIPGFYVLFYFSMVPFIAVLDDDADGDYFKKSRLLVKQNVPLIVWTSILNLIVDVSALLITPIQDQTAKVFFKAFFSIPDALFTLVMTVVTVKVFYHLKGTVPKDATESSQLAE